MKYKKEIYARVEEKLYNMQKKAKDDLEFRRDILYRRCPRAKEIEKELALTAIKVAKSILNGSDTKGELKRLRNNNLELQKELQVIIKQYSLPDDYLEERHECKKCEDKGFVEGVMCECMDKLLRKEMYNDLNNLSPLSLSTFETFSLDCYPDAATDVDARSPREIMSAVYKICLDYANRFSLHSSNIVMMGRTGLGKTHLSLAIANTVINRGFGVVYISTPNMVSYLENIRFKSNQMNGSEHFISCDLLIIDDLGTEFSTQFSNAAVYNIINSRMMMSKPTIINTNLSINELEKVYTERMASRIKGNAIVLEFKGRDIRQQRK